MAGADELVERMMEDARAEALRIDQETDARVRETDAQTELLAQRASERADAQAREAQQDLSRRAQAKRDILIAQTTLSQKRELLDAVFDDARTALDALPISRRHGILRALWRRARAQLDVGAVIVAEKDASFFTRRLSGHSSHRTDHRGSIMVSRSPCSGGFIAISADGTTRVDCRFDTLIDIVKAQETPRIAGILFKDDPKISTTGLGNGDMANGRANKKKRGLKGRKSGKKSEHKGENGKKSENGKKASRRRRA